MDNDLVVPNDLSGQPGAPFTVDEVAAAVEVLRAVLGWHVAPVKATTHVLDFEGTQWRLLPTQLLVSVDATTDAETTDPLVSRASRVQPYRLTLESPAPAPHEVEVTMTHGFTECPADLLPVIAGVARGARGGGTRPVASVGNGAYSVSYESAGDTMPAFSAQKTVERYCVFGIGFA